MKRELRTTSDGSSTLFIKELDEFYHSVHGALNESMHVFISNGFHKVEKREIRILEFGFGTGLNALLSFQEARSSGVNLFYHTLEAYPISSDEWSLLNYGQVAGDSELFEELHLCSWNETTVLEGGTLLKTQSKFETAELKANAYDLIYFDAFAPSAQPDLWSAQIFKKCLNALCNGGILVTYCAKGDVKRTMKSVGFEVKALPGPPKKREMTFAVKPAI